MSDIDADVVPTPRAEVIVTSPTAATIVVSNIGLQGNVGPTGPTGATGPVMQPRIGSFYDTTTQINNAGPTGYNTMRFNTTSISNGVSVVAQSRLTFQASGTYNVAFSAQFEKTDGGDDAAEIWLALNNNNISWTSKLINMHQQDAKLVAAWNFFITVAANDYAELRWHSNDANMRILARTAQINPNRPAVPSIIVTVNKIA
jgi:hypothetical protein